jgi:predicted amidohydrolase YtcJ
MTHCTLRRTLCKALTALLITASLPGQPALAQAKADLILTNGKVYTVDTANPWAQAIAISGDQILAVGSTAEVTRTAGENTQVIDLQGAFASPGFNDGHVHMDSTGMLITGVNLLDVHEPVAFAERIKGATERLPEGSWIIRGSWGAYEQWGQGSAGEDDSLANVASGPFTPDRQLIDAFTDKHPVLVSRFNRSMYLANSLALALAGIDENTPDPVGGEIARDGDGRVTGILRGTAVDLVQNVIPPMPFEQRLVGVRAVLEEARIGGVTTIQDLTNAEQMRAYQTLKENGELTARIMARPNIFQGGHIAALGITRGYGDDWLKIIGYKGWVDGIMGNSSAMFFKPYDHDPINRGALRPPMLPEAEEGAAFSMAEGDHYTNWGPGNMEQLIDAWADTGVPAHIHAIGDLGNRILLDIFERVLTRRDMVDSDHRWRIIHAQVVREEDFPRFGELNLVAEVNPYHVSDDMRWMEERIGARRSEGAYAFRKLKDAGAVLVFGSDSPGTNAARYFLSPVYGLYAAVSRQTLGGEPAEGWYPDQRLTIEEAIDAYTRAPAWASFEEDIKGTLTPGKLADIAVFDTDLVAAGRHDPASLLEAKVLYTIVGGEIVYQAE